MHFPRVVCIELKITPTSVSDVSSFYLRVVNENGILEQQVGNTVTRLQTATLDGGLLITTAAANTRFVFEVVTEEAAELPFVRSLNQREVVFPDIEVFAIRPGGLMPDIGISTSTPE